MNATRSYDGILAPRQALWRAGWRAGWIGEVPGLPVHAMRRCLADEAPSVLLTVGMHADEHAGGQGGFAVVGSRRLAGTARVPARAAGHTSFRLVASPLHQAARAGHQPPFLRCRRVLEAEVIEEATAPPRFMLAPDLQEDSAATGYYLCETKTQPLFVGGRIPQALNGIMPVTDNARFDRQRGQGLGRALRLTQRNDFACRRHWLRAFHRVVGGADAFLCSETPARLPPDIQVRAHLTVLQEALRFVTEALPAKPMTP